jgi:hypothetical protein
MKKIVLYTIYLFVGLNAFCQSGDFILLKKRNITQASYFAGSNIQFTTTTGAFIDAEIASIKNDSLLLKQYDIRQIPTNLGVYVLDTVQTYYLKFNYNQIKAIGKKGRKFSWTASGASLFGGGALLTLANGIVYLVDNKNFSPNLLAASVVLGGIGYLLLKNGNKGMVIGKKYSLVYIAANSIVK